MRLALLVAFIALTTPARAQWSRVTFPACSGNGCDPTDGFFAAPGWALADDSDRSYPDSGPSGAFVASTDGGATWTARRYNFASLVIDRRSVVTVEAGTAYAWMLSPAGTGIHTSPDGLTWTLRGAPYAPGQEIYVDLRRHNGALFSRSFRGQGRRIWRSTTLGQSWTDATGTLGQQQVGEVLGSAGTHLFATVVNTTTGVPSIWSTADDGATWTRRADAFPDAGGTTFATRLTAGGLARVGTATLVGYTRFVFEGGVFVATHLRRSTDGGASFAAVPLPLLATGREPGFVESFAVVDDRTVFLNTNEAVYLSRDAGATWARVDERRGTTTDGFVGQIHTDGRSLYRPRSTDFVERRPLSDFGVTTAAADAPVSEGSASTVGPNPASRTATLRFTLGEAQTVRVAVTDVLGRGVLALERTLGAGAHALPLDVSALAPGVYVARIAGARPVRFTVAR